MVAPARGIDINPASEPEPLAGLMSAWEPDRESRRAALRRLGASAADLDPLLDYTANPFDPSGPLTLNDEPFVSVWESYREASTTNGVFPVLQQALVQLRFPIRKNLGETEAYRAATRRGSLAALGRSGLLDGGLRLEAPERLRLELRPTPAGRIPVLTAPVRADFVALVQALTRRNAPTPLPDTMGALMVSGYNNWGRVARHRRAWVDAGGRGSWTEVFRDLVSRKDQYQDRFVLLSEGPYSGLAADVVGLDPARWVRVSAALRAEHEAAHYYCRRALGAMRVNAFDEVIADAYALACGTAGYREDWQRLFLFGSDGDAASGRLAHYTPGLSPAAVRIVERLVRSAVGRVAAVAQGPSATPAERARLLRRIVTACMPTC